MKSVALSSGTRRPSSHATAAEEARLRAIAEDEERQRTLYGPHADDARVLRVRGFVVTAEGGDRFRVGNQLLDGATLQAKADRERRLMGAPAEVRKPTETASRLRIGEVVAIERSAPKPARRAGGNRPARAAIDSAPTVNPAPRKLVGAAAAAKAASEQYSADLGARPRVVWLDLGLLQVDRRYQREIGDAGNSHVNRIAREFNWNRYQPIVVSEGADGRYAVIDGQHRLEAAKKHPLIRELPCYIIDAPDVAAQAAIFVSVNSRRLALTGLQKFWADVAAGSDHAVAVHEICSAAGLTILRSTPSSVIPPRSVYAAFGLQRLVQRFGRSRVATAVGLLAETHGGKANTFRAPTMAALVTIAGDRIFSRVRTKAALQTLDLDRLYEEARVERVAGGGMLDTATERVLRRHLAKGRA